MSMSRFFCAFVFVGALFGVMVEALVAQSPARTGAPDKAALARVVGEICSDGGQWLRCYSLDPARCSSITTAFVEPCVTAVFAEPSRDPTVQPIEQLLGCFNREFMRKYGHGEVKTPECANPMKHLMKPVK